MSAVFWLGNMLDSNIELDRYILVGYILILD